MMEGMPASNTRGGEGEEVLAARLGRGTGDGDSPPSHCLGMRSVLMAARSRRATVRDRDCGSGN
ncbi:hypothetical protein LIA77_02885 [Sarocladium implicatum]|nr:hypothetical protein LIA77_02885 [Sarocladium implicatum]